MGGYNMELLSWMKKVDGSMDKVALLELIDEMHGVINALLMENKEKEIKLMELREIVEVGQ